MFARQFTVTLKKVILLHVKTTQQKCIPYAITIKSVITRLQLFTIHSPDIQEIAQVEMETRIQIKCLEILIQEWQMSVSYTLN